MPRRRCLLGRGDGQRHDCYLNWVRHINGHRRSIGPPPLLKRLNASAITNRLLGNQPALLYTGHSKLSETNMWRMRSLRLYGRLVPIEHDRFDYRRRNRRVRTGALIPRLGRVGHQRKKIDMRPGQTYIRPIWPLFASLILLIRRSGTSTTHRQVEAQRRRPVSSVDIPTQPSLQCTSSLP